MQVLHKFDESRFWQRFPIMDFSEQQAVRILHPAPANHPVSEFDIRTSRLHRQTDEQWLRVTDNGVDYFTELGKSYYRSPELNQERAARAKISSEKHHNFRNLRKRQSI